MLTRTQDNEEIIERVAALDIGRAQGCAASGFPIQIIRAGGYSRWIPIPR